MMRGAKFCGSLCVHNCKKLKFFEWPALTPHAHSLARHQKSPVGYAQTVTLDKGRFIACMCETVLSFAVHST